MFVDPVFLHLQPQAKYVLRGPVASALATTARLNPTVNIFPIRTGDTGSF